MKSRRDGYLEFYRNTRLVRSLPLFILSAGKSLSYVKIKSSQVKCNIWIWNLIGNSILVVLIRMLSKYCPDKCTSANLEAVNFLQMFVSFEVVLLLPIMIYYLGNSLASSAEEANS